MRGKVIICEAMSERAENASKGIPILRFPSVSAPNEHAPRTRIGKSLLQLTSAYLAPCFFATCRERTFYVRFVRLFGFTLSVPDDPG